MDERALLYWHARYYVVSTAAGQVIVTDETVSLLLPGDHAHHLFTQIDGTKSTLDILARVDDLRLQAVLLHSIEQLLAQGMLVEHTPASTAVVYQRPDFRAASHTEPSPHRDLTLTILSQYANRALFVQWASALHVQRPTTVVVGDDYLDPRLAALNRQYLHDQRAWLLLKPTGHQPLLGPYLTSVKHQTPCWDCLACRMRRNQPVRLWLQGGPQADTLAVPIRYDPDAITRALELALAPAQQLLDGQLPRCVCALDLDAGSWTRHLVQRRPQCPTCGDRYLFTQHSSAGVVLHASPNIATQDGGWRSRTPQHTLAAVTDLVSPHTGVICEVSPLPEQPQDGVPVYRSAVYRTPWSKQRVTTDDFFHTTLGKGLSAEQSQASALGEALERYAAQYQGDEPQRFSQARHLDARALLPQMLAPFSARQYQHFGDPQHPEHRSRQAVLPHPPDMPLHWTLGYSLSREEPVYVPFTACYANTPFADERYVRWHSNGCAAGNTLEEALLQGFLELVERDAVAIWWYNKVPRPAVDLQPLPLEHRQRLQASLDPAWTYWVLDLTHDFRIPVMAAIGQHRTTHAYRLGFGCHLVPALACLRALTELCQLIAIKARGATAFDFRQITAEAYLFPAAGRPATGLDTLPVVNYPDLRDAVAFCMARAAQDERDIIVVNYTRPDLPLHTVKVIVPGLCHLWPRLGASRLYTVPVTLGWRTARLVEEQLNPLSLLL